jgi:hypothetical protein
MASYHASVNDFAQKRNRLLTSMGLGVVVALAVEVGLVGEGVARRVLRRTAWT